MSFWGPLIGKPFEYNARGPEAFDCWGLVHFVYKNTLGIDLPTYGEVDAADVAAVARRMRSPNLMGPWLARRGEAEVFDVVTIAAPGSHVVSHVGLMIDGTDVLHAWRDTNVCVMPIDHMFFTGRICGFWQHQGLSC